MIIHIYTGVIQHWSMVLIYILLELTVPGLLYFTLIHNESVLSWLVCGVRGGEGESVHLFFIILRFFVF